MEFAEVSLRLIAQQVANEGTGGLRLVREADLPHAGHVDQRAGIATAEELLGHGIVLTVLGDEPEQVVVVHEGDIDLTGGYTLDGGGVLGVCHRIVGQDALEPGTRRFLALDDA